MGADLVNPLYTMASAAMTLASIGSRDESGSSVDAAAGMMQCPDILAAPSFVHFASQRSI
jgi:hypothetical protein